MSPFLCLNLLASLPSREPSDIDRHMEVNPSLASLDKMIKTHLDIEIVVLRVSNSSGTLLAEGFGFFIPSFKCPQTKKY